VVDSKTDADHMDDMMQLVMLGHLARRKLRKWWRHCFSDSQGCEHSNALCLKCALELGDCLWALEVSKDQRLMCSWPEGGSIAVSSVIVSR